jgi:hypothetical protein
MFVFMMIQIILLNLNATVTPPIPPLEHYLFFARSVGGRLLLLYCPSGLDSVLQPHWEETEQFIGNL